MDWEEPLHGLPDLFQDVWVELVGNPDVHYRAFLGA